MAHPMHLHQPIGWIIAKDGVPLDVADAGRHDQRRPGRALHGALQGRQSPACGPGTATSSTTPRASDRDVRDGHRADRRGVDVMTHDSDSVPDARRAKSVVVGVDGSEGSFEALIWATHHAQRAGLPLQVVTITEIPAVYTAAGVPALPLGSTFDEPGAAGRRHQQPGHRRRPRVRPGDHGVGSGDRRHPGGQPGGGDPARRRARGVGHVAEEPHDRRARLGGHRRRPPRPRPGRRRPRPGPPRRTAEADRRRHRWARRIEDRRALGVRPRREPPAQRSSSCMRGSTRTAPRTPSSDHRRPTCNAMPQSSPSRWSPA